MFKVKFFIVIVSLCLCFLDLIAQEVKKDTATINSNKGAFYWTNAFMGKWNYFGALYFTQFGYKKPIFQHNKSFWYKDSYLKFAIEQEISFFTRTAAVIEFQPLAAFNFAAKIMYEGALAQPGKPVLIDNAHGDYNFALPPFTGLNPQTKTPSYIGGNNLIVQLMPTLIIGGPVGKGMIGFFYTPIMNFIHAFGVPADTYLFYAREVIVMKATDIFWRHDVKLGYQLPKSYGMSFAVTSDIEHIQSSKRLMRIGAFAAFSYQNPLPQKPSLIPFFRTKMGTWVKDDYLQGKFAFFVDAGITWQLN